jgi:hypothetical protein
VRGDAARNRAVVLVDGLQQDPVGVHMQSAVPAVPGDGELDPP